MYRPTTFAYRALAIAGMAALLACSAGGTGNPSSGGGAGASGGGSGGAGGSGAGGAGGSGGVLPTGGSGGSVIEGGLGGGGIGGGCAQNSYTGEVVPLDMYLLVDRSGSMTSVDSDGGSDSRWKQVTGAINEFMNLPGTNGLSVGLGFFPLPPSQPPPVNCASPADCYPYDDECLPIYNKCPSGWPVASDTSCLPIDYRVPAVVISPLPGAAGAVAAAIAATDPEGNTPIAPALWGAMEYAQPWAQAHADHVTMVVLASDGMPTGCTANEVSDVAAIAQGALQEAGILTFVIGIGTELTDLNEIAASGGTEKAFMVDTSSVGSQFLAALNEIRGSVACTYKIPQPDNGEADPNLLNVAYTPEGSAQVIFPKVPSAADCGVEPGWYYDDPSNPSQILLCPASCDMVQNGKGTVDVVIGCKTIVK